MGKVELRDLDILDLPDAPDFISEPPKYTFEEMLVICEKMLPVWNKIRYSKPADQGPQEAFILFE